MTNHPYAGDGRPYNGPDVKTMAILGAIVGVASGAAAAAADFLSHLW